MAWNDPNSDGRMHYGAESDVGLTGQHPVGAGVEVDGRVALGAADGEKVIEIQTRDLTNNNSVEPFYRATITLDTKPPELPVSLGDSIPCVNDGDCSSAEVCHNDRCSPPSVVIDDNKQYTNSSLGIVRLALNANDENGIASIWRPINLIVLWRRK